MKKLVVVAMSGGVDSSVAAALLQKKGYEVIGLTMCFGLKEAGTSRPEGSGAASGIRSQKPSCCGLEGVEDARRVAAKLGIKHYVLNFDKHLKDKVIKDFLGEYLTGRTPNPCIRCNQYLKFGELLRKARSLGAKYLATGHYVKKLKTQNSKLKTQEYFLKKAKDEKKDQSYFLYRVNQEQLRYLLFPLGNYTKTEVRELARKFDLPTAEKPGSQEVCFIPDNDYRKFLKASGVDADVGGGIIKDIAGNILGKHKGIAYYTIGQREGLNIAKGYPLYVIKINPEDNSIIVGKKEEAFLNGCIVKDLHLINSYYKIASALPRNDTAETLEKSVVLAVKIRYNHQEILSRVILISKNRAKVIFSAPQFAVTPGQAAVFYKKDVVVGGGIIEKSLIR